jgi:molecular chaperone IbpA
MRTAFDFSPLYRSVIGVDRMASLIESAMRSEGEGNYPPCDI